MRQIRKRAKFWRTAAVLSTSLVCSSLSAQQSTPPNAANNNPSVQTGAPKTNASGNKSNIQLVAQAQEPSAGTAPPTPEDIPLAERPSQTQQQPTLKSGGVGELTQGQQATYTPLNDIVSGGEAITRATTDVGDLLGKSTAALGVEVQRRTPIITDPHIRGFFGGQIVATVDGGYFFPTRPDLDTIVSRIDSTLVDNVVVIKGPYTVRLGPGFSFLDIQTVGTPRFDNFEGHGSTGVSYKTNGQGWSGRQAVWGGSADWGYRVGWDVLAAVNYTTGGGISEPSSYNMQNLDFAVGVNVNQNLGLEFRYFRTMQRNVEFPAAVTDINSLITDALTLRLVYKDADSFRSTLDTWYNHTSFDGDDLNGRPPLLSNLLGSTGPQKLNLNLVTNGDNNSWGFRNANTFGRDKGFQITGGGDFRYISQALNEFDTFFFTGAPGQVTFNFPVPRARQLDPGLFLDTAVPASDRLNFKAGGRVDFIRSGIQQPLTVPQPPLPFDPSGGAGAGANTVDNAKIMSDLGANSLDQRTFNLFSGFGNADYKLTDEITVQAAYGFAERAPTLVELYGDGPFLSLLQNGGTFVYGQGNPALKAEKLNQVDLGMKANYDRFRAGVSGYYAHVEDYITYLPASKDPTKLVPGLKGFVFINTPNASLSGFEMYSEYDLTSWLTPFATMNFTSGRDLSLHQALPSIYPLDSRVGFRVHDTAKQQRWGVEFTARLVNEQSQVASSLSETTTPGFIVLNIESYWFIRENFLVTAGIENLTNVDYQEAFDLRTPSTTGVFQPGFNFHLGFRLTY